MKPDISDKAVAKSPRLMDEVRSAIRVRHYSIRTEQAYVHWIAAFIRFNAMRHPRDLGAREVSAYLSYLATERDVAASTQQQALSALLFLYKQVLGVDLPWLQDLVRPKKPARLPTVLNQNEVARLLDAVPPAQALLARFGGLAGLLQASLADLPALPLQDRCALLRDRVRAFEAGTAPFDDLTLVLLEWHGSDGLPPPLPAQFNEC